MLRRVGGPLVALAMLAMPALAKACPDVALVLAFDASGSIDQYEYTLQLRATADALRSEEVVDAIRRAGTVALSAVIWGDTAAGSQIVGWDLLSEAEDAERVARRLETEPRLVDGNTDLGQGLWLALNQLRTFDGCPTRRIVNVSGDGRETLTPRRRHGVSTLEARRRAAEMNVVVNGLAIETEDRTLADYYRNYVAAGPGSFVLAVTEWGSFAVAMRGKLEREISPVEISMDDSLGQSPARILASPGGVPPALAQ